MLKVRSRRAGLFFWGPLSAVMILYGGGVLFGWQPVSRFLELLYPNGNRPAFETRDQLWGWVFLIGGGLLCAWYIWRYIIWGPVLLLDNRGIWVASPVTGFQELIPWTAVEQVYEQEHTDQLDSYPVLCLKMRTGDQLPRRPGRVRSANEQVWSITARNWDIPPRSVVKWVEKILPGLPADIPSPPDA